MFRSMVRIAALSAAVALVLALPATAQYLPAGEDRWVTPNDGSTYFTFPAGDVESLCVDWFHCTRSEYCISIRELRYQI